MRCPNPACKKQITCSIHDIEKHEKCDLCGTRFAPPFDMVAFLEHDVKLFTIFGIFVAIVTILPQNPQISSAFFDNATSLSTSQIFYQPPIESQLLILTVLQRMFTIACGMMILFIGTAILSDLFGGSRYKEIVLLENRFFIFRKEDPIRVIFAFPFLIIIVTLAMSIIILSGDFWWAYAITFAAFEGIIILLTYLAFKKETPTQQSNPEEWFSRP